MRAWVEICNHFVTLKSVDVALHVRAWVEIGPGSPRGPAVPVALHVRAWVEITVNICKKWR